MSGHWLWEALAAGGALLAGGAVALWRSGWNPVRWARRRRRPGVNGSLDDIKETLVDVRASQERAMDVAEDTREDVRRVERKVDAVGETVFRLHEDDPLVTDADALRSSLDVEDLPDDFLRGGEGEGGG